MYSCAGKKRNFERVESDELSLETRDERDRGQWVTEDGANTLHQSEN